jgi:hypothetical protein
VGGLPRHRYDLCRKYRKRRELERDELSPNRKGIPKRADK